MLMLLSVHVTSVLFLVRFNNFALTMELHALTLVTRSYALLIVACVKSNSYFEAIHVPQYLDTLHTLVHFLCIAKYLFTHIYLSRTHSLLGIGQWMYHLSAQ